MVADELSDESLQRTLRAAADGPNIPWSSAFVATLCREILHLRGCPVYAPPPERGVSGLAVALAVIGGILGGVLCAVLLNVALIIIHNHCGGW